MKILQSLTLAEKFLIYICFFYNVPAVVFLTARTTFLKSTQSINTCAVLAPTTFLNFGRKVFPLPLLLLQPYSTLPFLLELLCVLHWIHINENHKPIPYSEMLGEGLVILMVLLMLLEKIRLKQIEHSKSLFICWLTISCVSSSAIGSICNCSRVGRHNISHNL